MNQTQSISIRGRSWNLIIISARNIRWDTIELLSEWSICVSVEWVLRFIVGKGLMKDGETDYRKIYEIKGTKERGY